MVKEKIGNRGRLGMWPTLLVLFFVFFPKGGIKVGEVPITWGLILLVLVGAYCLLGTISKGRIGLMHLVAFICTLPFFFVILVTAKSFGYSSFGYMLSYILNFFFMPLLFTLLFYNNIKNISMNRLIRLVNFGVLFASVYGIFLFIYKIKVGNFIEIPFLTVNSGDIGALEEKNINRGSVFKLISTYNNGNIFGVCMLMLLPLFCSKESLWKQVIVKVAIFLTLSRTAWVGLILFEVYKFFRSKKGYGFLIKLIFVIIALSATIFFCLLLLQSNVMFLLDPNLGGRVKQFDLVVNFFPSSIVTPVGEVVYMSILKTFGLIGLATFLIAMTAPIAISILSKQFTGYRVDVVAGMVIYLIISMSDGAIMLIPTMTFYWGLVALLLAESCRERQSVTCLGNIPPV